MSNLKYQKFNLKKKTGASRDIESRGRQKQMKHYRSLLK